MPLPAKARERCREFLEDGDRIQYLIPGISLYVNGVRAANLEASRDGLPENPHPDL